MNDEDVCVGVECQTPVALPDTLCDVCVRVTGIYRDELPGLWYTAHLLLPPGRRPPDIRSAVMLGAKPPVNLHVVELLIEALDVVTYWAEIVLVANGEPSVPIANSRIMFDAAIEALVHFDRSLNTAEFAVDYHYALYRQHRQLRWLVRGESEGRIFRSCPSCGRDSLIHRNEHVTCLTCAASWLQATYQVLWMCGT